MRRGKAPPRFPELSSEPAAQSDHILMPRTVPTGWVASQGIYPGLGSPNTTKPSITTSGMSASSITANSGICM